MSTPKTPANITADERINELENRLAATQAMVERQSEQIAQLLSRLPAAAKVPNHAPDGGVTDAPQAIPSALSRRSMLKNAALATLGVATVMEVMPSAKATNSNYLNLGGTNSASAYTELTASVGIGATLGVRNTGSGYGVYASATSGAGLEAASTSGNGVRATTTSSSSTGASAAAVAGISNSTSAYGVGVYGQCDTGTGLFGQSAQYYGAFLRGGLAPVLLAANTLTNPNSDTQTHAPGELYVDVNKGLWYNTTYGTPGLWLKLADASTAGAFNLLPTPTRVVDTRSPSESASSTGQQSIQPYTVNDNGGREFAIAGPHATPYTPSGTTATVIPPYALAFVGRLTVIAGKNGNTAAGGSLKVSNRAFPDFGTGLATWGAGPSVQIVSVVLQMTENIIWVANNSSDVIDICVDVTGYYY